MSIVVSKSSLLFAVCVIFLSCKDEEHTETGHHMNSATITISSPTTNDQFHHNDTVQVVATAMAVEDLHGYEVRIRRMPDSLVVFSTDSHTHGTTVQIRETWVCTISDSTDMEVEIAVVLDHEGNKTRKSQGFRCVP
jgi:hypothetical protein